MFTNTNVLNQFNALKTMKNVNDAEIVKSPKPAQLAEIASGGSGSQHLVKADSTKSVEEAAISKHKPVTKTLSHIYEMLQNQSNQSFDKEDSQAQRDSGWNHHGKRQTGELQDDGSKSNKKSVNVMLNVNNPKFLLNLAEQRLDIDTIMASIPPILEDKDHDQDFDTKTANLETTSFQNAATANVIELSETKTAIPASKLVVTFGQNMHKRAATLDKSKDSHSKSKKALLTVDSNDRLLRKERARPKNIVSSSSKPPCPPQNIKQHYQKIERYHKRNSLNFLKDETLIL
jgi:hypothetical protein